MIPELTVDFCGEIYRVDPGQSFSIGREGDLTLDEVNPFLHRVFLRIEFDLACGGCVMSVQPCRQL